MTYPLSDIWTALETDAKINPLVFFVNRFPCPMVVASVGGEDGGWRRVRPVKTGCRSGLYLVLTWRRTAGQEGTYLDQLQDRGVDRGPYSHPTQGPGWIEIEVWGS